MKFKKIVALIICVVMFSGCNHKYSDEQSNSQSCADCVWNNSSQKLVLTWFGGGITGQTSRTEYDRADIPSEILSALEKLKRVPFEEYYHDRWCSAGGGGTVFTVVDLDGKEIVYRGNRKNDCENRDETENYIDDYEMQNIIRLFQGTILTPIWNDASERFEMLMKTPDSTHFVSIADFTSDTLRDNLRRRLPSLSAVKIAGIATCPDKPDTFNKYVLRVTDSSGISRDYFDEISARCNSELDQNVYVSSSDIHDLDLMINPSSVTTTRPDSAPFPVE